MIQIVAHGGAAIRVLLALHTGFGATHVAGSGHARLDGSLGRLAKSVRGAVAVLQRRAVRSEVELDDGLNAVTGTFLLAAVQHGTARL